MRNKLVLTLLTIVMPMFAFGQSFDALWAKVKTAEEKDLPKTQQDVLMQIVAKAQRERAYGQLMAAELKAAQVSMQVAPDSLSPAVDRMEARMQASSDEVLRTVYATVLYGICRDNPSLERTVPKPELTPALCGLLAAVKAVDYKPLTETGRDSRWFNDDMLSVVGYELKDFLPLNTFYNKVGNRVAALMTALEIARMERPKGHMKLNEASYLNTLDSIIAGYGDLSECGEVAIERYNYLLNHTDASEETLWQYLQEAKSRWGNYERMNELRNAQQNLTRKHFSASLYKRLAMPDEEQMLKVLNIKNLSELTVRIYRAKVDGDTKLKPNDEKDYKKLKPLLTELPELRITKTYNGKPEYETFSDSIPLPGLPVGVYMIEMESKPSTSVSRQLYFVSNVRTLLEALPDHRLRFVVVDAKDGQPVKGATVELRGYRNGRSNQTMATLTTNDKGEASYQYNTERPTNIFTHTAADKACLPMNSYGRFVYNESDQRVTPTVLFTDRAIYRPGQTVHVVAIHYEVEHGYNQKVLKDQPLTLTLRDANYKTVAEQTLTTDRYGSCSADFTLPTNGLTGYFRIQTENGSCSFRVEEYKRPTFEVEFDKVTEDYKDGDTLALKGTARSYAGVPVQNAKVTFKVTRNPAFWWWRYGNDGGNENTVAEGETETGSDGTFTVKMPMVLPKTDYPMFYSFVCQADVTDQGGETHQGQLSLPLGNRKTAFSLELPEQVRVDKGGKVTFELRNAAGNHVDATARYRIDNGKWLTAKTNTAIDLPKLASGRYTMEAICKDDTVKQSFVVFSLDDKRPAPDTEAWFYQSDNQFPNDGTPVTIQVGSSDKNVHIVYSVFSGERVIESGSVERSNELLNRKWTYKEEYGNGLLLNFAWVKQGVYHIYEAHIQRPLPDKRLKLEWKTFRDRLTPGQHEEWSLTVKKPSSLGKGDDDAPVDALLMATLYDKSLDQITPHNWSFVPYLSLPLPFTNWQHGNWDWGGLSLTGEQRQTPLKVNAIALTHFDSSLFPHPWMRNTVRSMRLRGAGKPLMEKAVMAESTMDVKELDEVAVSSAGEALQGRIGGLSIVPQANITSETSVENPPEIQLRENLQETAFFYPRLLTDADGQVTLKFTLPESLTTWRFMGLAHTADLCYGLIDGEAVAKKDLMIQPNVPRFLREGDRATISSRIINTSERDLSGSAWLTLIDPDTEKAILSRKAAFTVKAGETTSVMFDVDTKGVDGLTGGSLLIAKLVATTEEYSDGEQHYLPILPNQERVTVTVPFTQNEPGTKTVDLTKLVPANVKDAKLTIEYTNNPAWLMIQTLPAVGHAYDDCAVCQAASLYANSIGKYITDQVPQAKTVFEQWKREHGSETSLHSQLQKNQELKDLLLNETPWVADADREEEQRQRLADFFDENLMQQRLTSAIEKLGKLQRNDGSWSWWPDMPGSIYMTISVTEMMVRQNCMVGEQSETKQMLSMALKFLGKEMVEQVKEMKKQEKKGIKQIFPGNNALQWLYICKLDGRQMPEDVQQANQYLMTLLKKETKHQTIYQKALSAIILDSPTYIKSLKEYTVYKEEMGRYYDTPRAGYSWRDYRIPTQVAAIEAIQRLTPNDQHTLDEMRRWLLQEKRTQAWDTPLNSADAVYAFLCEKGMVKSDKLMAVAPAVLSLDGKSLNIPKATAGVGYVKTAQPYTGEKIFEAEKTSGGTSWGAVYAQFIQPASDIQNQSSGISVTREILLNDEFHAKQGDRITVRLTIQSERDYDFVQLQDKRAACLEPVSQLSGYNWRGGYYCTPRDNTTNYYFDRLSKGKHVIETEYYIDRIGTYETGTCTVECAYAPEYRAKAKSASITVEE